MWADDAFIYHVYALGACGALRRNDFRSPPKPRLDCLVGELDRLAELGVTALLLGPVFEATSHGYDTADYLTVDRRLGDRATLQRLSEALSARGMRLLLDAVLNHVGRDFWAFRDVLEHGPDSRYSDWFHIDFTRRGRSGDPFAYQGWAGSTALVNLNLDNPGVREHLLNAVGQWINEFGVSGLRLDAADVMSPDFLALLAEHCRNMREDFWLIGEIVLGDYSRLARPGLLDSTTNYEAYHALWTSHRDHNYHSLARALDREFGPGGAYRGLPLLSFADNHDVDRVASSVADAAQLYPLYGVLFTMPGVPSLYYGSEWGIRALRTSTRDRDLRPSLKSITHDEPDLPDAIRRLARVRSGLGALRYGDYQQVHVSNEQFAFTRSHQGQTVTVAVNNSTQWAQVPVGGRAAGFDHLEGATVECPAGGVWVPPHWLRVLT